MTKTNAIKTREAASQKGSLFIFQDKDLIRIVR